MAEGLEVVIKYRGAKYAQVAAPTMASAEFAILKKDLAHLRVHSPSQKNVRRVDGSFVLHWPTAGTSPKVDALSDSLHTRWFKLCSADPEARKLRDFLSIESITLTQDGVPIRSTVGAVQASQDVPPGSRSNPMLEMAPQPPTFATATTLQPPPLPPAVIPPPRVPPTAPRLDRQAAPHLKRRMSSGDGLPNPTRQKLDVSVTHPLPITPLPDRVGDTTAALPPPTSDGAIAPLPATGPQTTTTPTPSPPSREPGEMTPHAPVPCAPRARPVSPRPGSASSSGTGESHAPRRRERDVSRLTRELWDTRRHLTAMQAREQVLLDDLNQLGVRPDAGAERHGVSREELVRLEAELRVERARRMRAERALTDVERECREPFVVPALFHAFLSISELSN